MGNGEGYMNVGNIEVGAIFDFQLVGKRSQVCMMEYWLAIARSRL